MNTKSHSIEEIANKLKKLKTKKEKLDLSIIDLESQLDEALKTLGINQKIVYRDVNPTYLPYNPIITYDITPLQTQWSNTSAGTALDFTPTTTFDV